MIEIPPTTQGRIVELLTLFKLPTMAGQTIRRFVDAGHREALGTLLEVDGG